MSLRLAQTLARIRRQSLIRLMERHLELTLRLPDLSLRAAARQLPSRMREARKDLRGELSLLSSGLLEATATAARLWVP
jgi:hypothetical protein